MALPPVFSFLFSVIFLGNAFFALSFIPPFFPFLQFAFHLPIITNRKFHFSLALWVTICQLCISYNVKAMEILGTTYSLSWCSTSLLRPFSWLIFLYKLSRIPSYFSSSFHSIPSDHRYPVKLLSILLLNFLLSPLIQLSPHYHQGWPTAPILWGAT